MPSRAHHAVRSPARSGAMPGGTAALPIRSVSARKVQMRKARASTTMPRTDLPIAATKGAASSRAARDCEIPASDRLATAQPRVENTAQRHPWQRRTAARRLGRAAIGAGEDMHRRVQVAGRQLLRQVGLLLAWSELSAGGPRPAPTSRSDRAGPRGIDDRVRQPGSDRASDASLLIAGDPFWLQMLVTEIVTLRGASGAPPTVKLDRHAGGSALGFFWSGFRADRAGDLRLVLIKASRGCRAPRWSRMRMV